MSPKTLKDFFHSAAQPVYTGAGGGQNVGANHQMVPTPNSAEKESIEMPMPMNPLARHMPYHARTPSPTTMKRYVKAGQHFPYQGVFKKMYDQLGIKDPNTHGPGAHSPVHYLSPAIRRPHPQAVESVTVTPAHVPKPNPVYFTPDRKIRRGFPPSPNCPRKKTLKPETSPLSSGSGSSDLFSNGTIGGSGVKVMEAAGSNLMCDANRAAASQLDPMFFPTTPTTPDGGSYPMMSPKNADKKRSYNDIAIAAAPMPASSSSSSTAGPEVQTTKMSLDLSFNLRVSESKKRRL